jgi:hypothetical protein
VLQVWLRGLRLLKNEAERSSARNTPARQFSTEKTQLQVENEKKKRSPKP